MRTLVTTVPELECTDLFPYVSWHPYCKYLDLPAGTEHYRLLAFLSLQLERNERILDIGTFLGMSAIALSYNRLVQVHTFDIEDSITTQGLSPKHRSNIVFHMENILDTLHLYIDAPLIFLDTNHDGIFEKQFIEKLESLHYKGIVMCDDIHLNEAMKDFWTWVSSSHTTQDLTSVGHWSGTGAILFDTTTISLST